MPICMCVAEERTSEKMKIEKGHEMCALKVLPTNLGGQRLSALQSLDRPYFGLAWRHPSQQRDRAAIVSGERLRS